MLKYAAEIGRILWVLEIEQLFITTRKLARERILGGDITVTASRFIDTWHGAVLTSVMAIEKATEKVQHDII